MRIGMVVPSCGFVGGVERHAHDLAASLRARGHEITLLHGEARGKDPARYAAPFARVLPVSRARQACGRLDAVWVHRARDPDELRAFDGLPVVVATHDHELTCVRAHRYLPVGTSPCHRAPGVACVTHGCIAVRDRSSRALPVALRSPFALRRRLLGLARRAPLVACSRYVAEQTVRAGVAPDSVHVVYPIPPEHGAAPTKPPRTGRLGVVGNLLRGKGVDIAIRALGHLPAGVSLDVVGDGPSRPALERLARRLAPGRVRFHGWVPPSRLGDVYGELALVVVPSRWPEPFGMTGIEAMRRGRAVVGAGHGGIPEWLEPGRAGLPFEPGSAASLADAVRQLLGDRDAGLRAFAWATERFPHRRMVDEVERLLGAVTGRRIAC